MRILQVLNLELPSYLGKFLKIRSVKGLVKSRLATHQRMYETAAAVYRLMSWGYNRLGSLSRVTDLSANGVSSSRLHISKTQGLVQIKMNNDVETVSPRQAFCAHYEEEEDFAGKTTDIKAIAYHLPQFHAIPENDEWWGEGFTEWNNTRKAKPLFPGHYQPREPHDDIGYYDLSDVVVLKKQVAMAKRHGIYGFCFYHYWFHGKRLLDKPVDMLLRHTEIDMPFCFCWANETWSKKWDGRDHHILIEQTFSPEDDIKFIEFLAPYFRDPRYIRVDDKPMLQVYRISKLPDPQKTAERWRTWCRENGIGEIHLVAVCHGEVFPHTLLKNVGFDAYAAFPPHSFPCEQIQTDRDVFDGGYRFDYASGVEAHRYNPTDTCLYEGCTLGWDNTARFGSKAQIYLNFSLERYYEWLRKNIDYTRTTFPSNERFLFINAWNEWAEGSYLEPDKKCGYSCLNITSRALFDMPLGSVPGPENVSATRYTRDYERLKRLIANQEEHSLAAIAKFIQPHCEILEFGPASGYFTRYLNQEKDATVDIAELDPICAEQAAKYARLSYVGDIEQYVWKKVFAGRVYDYILFADVLEHLRDPWTMLEEATHKLKPGGAIIISVPNIAHVQILASLYNNDFSYADVGILDRTHLRFFTEPTLRQMIEGAGLSISGFVPIQAPVLPQGCGTGWNNAQVPSKLFNLLAKKQYAHAIQFVACCQIKG